MAIQAETEKLLEFDSKSKFYRYMYNEKEAIVKEYYISNNRSRKVQDILLKTMKEQIITEAKVILKCKSFGIAVPTLYLVDVQNHKIIMENISGQTVELFLRNNFTNTEELVGILFEIGTLLGELHKNNVVHGCLNTSNMLLNTNGSIILINLGSRPCCLDPSINDKVVDLYILEKSLINMHWQIANKFWLILNAYIEAGVPNLVLILEKFKRLKIEIPVGLNSLSYIINGAIAYV